MVCFIMVRSSNKISIEPLGARNLDGGGSHVPMKSEILIIFMPRVTRNSINPKSVSAGYGYLSQEEGRSWKSNFGLRKVC
jgi:hypothetical protein